MMKALDVATDELNVLLGKASELLRRDFHGVRAEVTVTGARTLAFGCVDNVWGLILIREPSVKAVPLTSATREERIMCAGLLDKLHDTLSLEKDALDARLRQAKTQVRTFIERYA